MILKLIGSMLIMITTSAIGISFSMKLKERVDKLNLIKQMIEEMITLIRYQAVTVYEILNTLNSNPVLSRLEFIEGVQSLSNNHKSFEETWCNGIDLYIDRCFKPEDKQLILNIGCSLGNSDIDGQISTLTVYKENLNQLIESAIEERNRKAKMYNSLGVLFGAFLAIMLI